MKVKGWINTSVTPVQHDIADCIAIKHLVTVLSVPANNTQVLFKICSGIQDGDCP